MYHMKDLIPELKFSKSASGVEFTLNVADSSDRPAWFGWKDQYVTDFFEFYFFHTANGYVIKRDNTNGIIFVLIIKKVVASMR